MAVDPTTYLRSWGVPQRVKVLPPVELPDGAPSGFGSAADFRRLLDLYGARAFLHGVAKDGELVGAVLSIAGGQAISDRSNYSVITLASERRITTPSQMNQAICDSPKISASTSSG